MNTCIRVILILLAVCLLVLPQQIRAQFLTETPVKPNSWKECQEKKSGYVTVQVFDLPPYIEHDANGRLMGIEVELFEEFVRFVHEIYGVKITPQYVGTHRFNLYWGNVLQAPNGYFSIGPNSITEERKKQIRFSPPYMPDIEVMISSTNIPFSTMDNFTKNFKSRTAVTIRSSTFAIEVEGIKQNYFPQLPIEYVQNSDEVLQKLTNNPDRFAFMELPVYLMYLRKGYQLKRHNVFKTEREGYAIAYSLNSDWEQPINQFFSSPRFRPLMNRIMHKYLGEDIPDLLFKADDSESALADSEIRLLSTENEIRELEIKRRELKLQEQALRQYYLWAAVVIFLVVTSSLLYAYISIHKKNILLAQRNNEILQQQEEIRTTQTQLALAEKMASLGKLVANVSHELNSPLAAIRAHTQLLQTAIKELISGYGSTVLSITPERAALLQAWLDISLDEVQSLSTQESRKRRKTMVAQLESANITEPEETARLLLQVGILDASPYVHTLQNTENREILMQASKIKLLATGLDNIEAGTERTRKVLYALNAFKKEKKPKTNLAIDVAKSIEATLKEFSKQLHGIENVQIAIAPGTMVFCEQQDLHQMWSHLIQNAIHAVQRVEHPSLEIRCVPGTEYLRIEFIDNGPGIAKEIQEHLFEPFTSTKPVGEGSGLGLFICKHIAELYNGSITVNSVPGETRFIILLPKATC